MIINAIKTEKIVSGAGSIFDVLDRTLATINEGSIVAVTSKIVSICEGNVVPKESINKEDLIVQEADYYLPASLSKYGYHFTITDNTLISVAGIDESNGEGYYILWPKNSQKTANEIREHLQKKHGLKKVGVVITDSTCNPLRRGTVGISMAHSGFKSLRNYIGTPDLFGRPFGVTQANIAGGLAGAAVLAMGEGTEQTPLCVLTDLDFIEFQDRNPNLEELAETTIEPEDDLFAPFLNAVTWQKGKRGKADD
jgi:putative folate metabolism gamma-glutamate ligase